MERRLDELSINRNRCTHPNPVNWMMNLKVTLLTTKVNGLDN